MKPKPFNHDVKNFENLCVLAGRNTRDVLIKNGGLRLVLNDLSTY